MIDKNLTYALVWASVNPEKYGNKILQDLLDGWYTVIPVNPNENEILWQQTFSFLSDISQKIDIVIFVVPPFVTEKVLDEVIVLWIKKVWMQPGSESENAIQKCIEAWIELVYNSCIMIQRK